MLLIMELEEMKIILNEIKKIAGLIYKGGFKPGYTNRHENCLDQKHPGKKVGIGVYCSQLIKTAENFSGISNINGKQYKTYKIK